jgi:hypothetical protein
MTMLAWGGVGEGLEVDHTWLGPTFNMKTRFSAHTERKVRKKEKHPLAHTHTKVQK